MTSKHALFHSGEREAQRRAYVGDVASWAKRLIRDHMPEQHRIFFQSLPFLIAAGGDAHGRPWVTLLEGPPGFCVAPDPQILEVHATPHSDDPLAEMLRSGGAIGLLGIDLATRRRNRLNGVVQAANGRLKITVQQSFGNCPQYIHERILHRADAVSGQPAQHSRQLSADQLRRILTSDTLFIGSGYSSVADSPVASFDASHRGGAKGFVRVSEEGKLLIPDYAGNKFFNTIGNLLRNPRIGLLWVDFEAGSLLHVTGKARIDWTAKDNPDPNAKRMIEVSVDAVLDRPGALALRWTTIQQ